MIQSPIKIIVGLCLFSLLSCATYPYNYYLGQINALNKNNKVIAIAPFGFSTRKDYIATKYELTFEKMIDSVLTQAGYSVIKTDKTMPIAASVRNSLGGLFDPNSGNIDTIKKKQAYIRFTDSLKKDFAISGVLYPTIIYVTATVNNGIAWHGRHIPYFGFANIHGYITCLSLYVKINDSEGNMIFENAGGIEPIQRINALGDLDNIPSDQLLTNTDNYHAAVGIVFNPLIQQLKKLSGAGIVH